MDHRRAGGSGLGYESGLDYEPVPADTRLGDQHRPEFPAINPNAKEMPLVEEPLA